MGTQRNWELESKRADIGLVTTIPPSGIHSLPAVGKSSQSNSWTRGARGSWCGAADAAMSAYKRLAGSGAPRHAKKQKLPAVMAGVSVASIYSQQRSSEPWEAGR